MLDGNWDQGICRRHAPEAWAEIWEKAVSWVPASEEEGWLPELGEARRLCALRAPRVGWVESWRCKSSQHRKIASLSPHVEKPLNSKRWIKVSYLNQFRKVSCFGIPMFYIYIWVWTFYVRFTYPYHGYVTLPRASNISLVTSTSPVRGADQAYPGTPCPLEEILNLANSSFFWLLISLITYLFSPRYQLLTRLHSSIERDVMLLAWGYTLFR